LMILVKAISRARDGEPLALLFAPLSFIGVVFGILEQPTDQGFMVMFLAFSLAAIRQTETKAKRTALNWQRPRLVEPYSSARKGQANPAC